MVNISNTEIQINVLTWPIAGLFTFAACSVSFWIIYKHLKNYKHPSIQRCAIRIVLMIPIFAVDSYLSLVFRNQSFYFNVARDCYEAYVLYMFFRLMVELADGEEPLIQKLEGLPEIKYLVPFCMFHIKPGRIFLHRCKQFILQYVLVKLALTIVTFATQLTGYYEEGVFSPNGAYLYVTITYNISISLSLYFLILFYEATKDILKPFKPLYKFICIKAIVFFTFWQSLVISMMVSFNFIISGVDDYSVGDVAVALQSFLICIEMFPLAIAHMHTFGYKAFTSAKHNEFIHQNMLNRIIDSFSLHDVVFDTFSALKKGPKRNVNVGAFMLFSREEQLEHVLKQDWLEKRGEDLIKKWKRRYFLLIDEPYGLVYFKKDPFQDEETISGKQMKARGFIRLSEVIGVVDSTKRGPGEFIILTPRRKWHMRAANSIERDAWIASITQHLPISDVSIQIYQEEETHLHHEKDLEIELKQLRNKLNEKDTIIERMQAEIAELKDRNDYIRKKGVTDVGEAAKLSLSGRRLSNLDANSWKSLTLSGSSTNIVPTEHGGPLTINSIGSDNSSTRNIPPQITEVVTPENENIKETEAPLNINSQETKTDTLAVPENTDTNSFETNPVSVNGIDFFDMSEIPSSSLLQFQQI